MAKTHGRVLKGCIKIVLFIVVYRTYFQLKDLRQFSDVDNDLQKSDFKTGIDYEEYHARDFSNRHLLTLQDSDEENCTKRGIESFPQVFTNKQRLYGAVIVNFLVAFYMFGVIGYNCDFYFVPALEILCEELKIKPDVAGATFMAVGSSAPEFFSALIGTFISEDDTALSAIVGSAAFNVFIIIGFCCFFAKQEVPLTGWPLFRDGMFYILSVLLLVIFIFDSTVYWWEALVMVLAYLCYIIFMHYNTYFHDKASNWLHPERKADKTLLVGQHQNQNSGSYGALTLSYSKSRETVSTAENGDIRYHNGDVKHKNGDTSYHNGSIKHCDTGFTDDQNGFVRSDRSDPMDGTISEYKSLEIIPHVFKPPEHIVNKIIWFMGFPAILLMFLTVPNVQRPRWRKWYLVSFCMSLLWLMGTSYVLYWMIVVIGFTFNIPDTVMGITLLAGGTSVPDLLASVIVTRHGFGDMALSNVIGSNIFDVLMCLGFNWLLKAAFIEPVTIATEGLTYTAITLMITVLVVIFAIYVSGWTLNLKLGIICLTIYIIFITLAVLRELGTIGHTEPPFYCPVL